jgi:putative lipoic acid-binding regulatory protein
MIGTMANDTSLLVFPCDFPIKVMGRAGTAFRAITLEIVERHAGRLEPGRIAERASSRGNYQSITYTIEARSREQLDAIYLELTASGIVLVAL